MSKKEIQEELQKLIITKSTDNLLDLINEKADKNYIIFDRIIVKKLLNYIMNNNFNIKSSEKFENAIKIICRTEMDPDDFLDYFFHKRNICLLSDDLLYFLVDKSGIDSYYRGLCKLVDNNNPEQYLRIIKYIIDKRIKLELTLLPIITKKIFKILEDNEEDVSIMNKLLNKESFEISCKHIYVSLIKQHLSLGFKLNKKCFDDMYLYKKIIPQDCYDYYKNYDSISDDDDFGLKSGKEIYNEDFFLDKYRFALDNKIKFDDKIWFRNIISHGFEKVSNDKYNKSTLSENVIKLIKLFQEYGLQIDYSDVIYFIQYKIEIPEIENYIIFDKDPKIKEKQISEIKSKLEEHKFTPTQNYLKALELKSDNFNPLKQFCLKENGVVTKSELTKAIKQYGVEPDFECLENICTNHKNKQIYTHMTTKLGINVTFKCLENCANSMNQNEMLLDIISNIKAKYDELENKVKLLENTNKIENKIEDKIEDQVKVIKKVKKVIKKVN